MSFLIDTNVLIRYANVADRSHTIAVTALMELHRRDESLHISPQNVIEFWNVATRPAAANGLGLSTNEVAELVELLEMEFSVVAETADIYPALRRLLQSANVVGKQVHDARLVAICQVNSIGSILTFNPRHFARFVAIVPGLSIVEPAALCPSSP